MPGTPTEVVAAKKAERIAWTAYEHGLRNVYTAAGPAFAPVRLTNVTKDDGVELERHQHLGRRGDRRRSCAARSRTATAGLRIRPRIPAAPTRTIWAARTSGGGAWKLGEGTTPVLSPDGRTVAYAKDGQIYAYAVRLKPDMPEGPEAAGRRHR